MIYINKADCIYASYMQSLNFILIERGILKRPGKSTAAPSSTDTVSVCMCKTTAQTCLALSKISR